MSSLEILGAKDLRPLSVSATQGQDGLVDILIRWADVAPDPSSIQLVRIGRSQTQADATRESLVSWTVVTDVPHELRFRETLDQLLPGGDNMLEVVVDTDMPTPHRDTVMLSVELASLHTSIPTGLEGIATGVAICPDDERVYVTLNRSIVVVDARRLELITSVHNPQAPVELRDPLCVLGDERLYVAGGVHRFDRRRLRWLPAVPGAYVSNSLVSSRRDPDIIYAGEYRTGAIARIDREPPRRLGDIGLPWSTVDEYILDLEVLSHDERLYATSFLEGGILVADPRSGRLLHRISLGTPESGRMGRTDNLALSSDDAHLFAAARYGGFSGLIQIETASDSVVRRLNLTPAIPIDIALSPDGSRAFVTTQDSVHPSERPSSNLLIDVRGWRVLSSFPRPRLQGELRFDLAAAFHPNGRLIFVARDSKIDVYVNRE